MFCTGCGAKAADNDALCGGCGNARRPASGEHGRPAKAVFHLGQAMQQQAMAIPPGATRWRWAACALALIALALCVFMAAC